MSYDNWKTTNSDDEWLGPEPPQPPPCLPQRTRKTRMQPTFVARGLTYFEPVHCCADCGAPEGECWWNDEPIGQFEAAAIMRDRRR